MQPGYHIRFDPQDLFARDFLTQLGVSTEDIDRGEIAESDDHSPLRHTSLIALAESDQGYSNMGRQPLFSRTGTVFLSAAEAGRGLSLFQKYAPDAVRSLFMAGSCPGSGGTFRRELWGEWTDVALAEEVMSVTAGVMLDNLLGIPDRRNSDALYPSLVCPYDPLLPPVQQRGVYYRENAVPAGVATFGKAVIPVMIEGQQRGSAIVVSQSGLILTAAHVLKEPAENGWRQAIMLVSGGHAFSVGPESALLLQEETDIALIRIPEIAGTDTSPLPLRGISPLAGETTWAIGFPGRQLIQTEALNHESQRLFTTGVVLDNDPRNRPHEFELDIQADDGWSGGAVVDSDGMVIGVITSKWGVFAGRKTPGAFAGTTLASQIPPEADRLISE